SVDTTAWGAKAEAHIGVARVPDPKVDRLAELFGPKKITYASVEYVDLPGLERRERGATSQPRDLSAYLTNPKGVDALLHVVRAFQSDAIPHSEGSVDPSRDLGLFELEMIFSDLVIVEKRLERLDKDLKKSRSAELEAEQAVLLRLRTAL